MSDSLFLQPILTNCTLIAEIDVLTDLYQFITLLISGIALMIGMTALISTLVLNLRMILTLIAFNVTDQLVDFRTALI